MRFAGVFLFLGILVLGCSVANAGPSSNRIKQGPGLLDQLLGDSDAASSSSDAKQMPVTTQSDDQRMALESSYDGVWHDRAGRLLLVKRIHRTLYLSGSSDNSAWQTQCVMSGATAKCLGSGISKIDGEFRCESDLHLDGDTLQSDWTRHYSNGRSDSGNDALQRLK